MGDTVTIRLPRPEDPTEVTCPRCRQGPGVPCCEPSGHVRTHVHDARQDALWAIRMYLRDVATRLTVESPTPTLLDAHDAGE